MLTAATTPHALDMDAWQTRAAPRNALRTGGPSTRSDIGGGRIRQITTHRKVTRNGERRDSGDITLSGGMEAKP
jgi:hypothetical protein